MLRHSQTPPFVFIQKRCQLEKVNLKSLLETLFIKENISEVFWQHTTVSWLVQDNLVIPASAQMLSIVFELVLGNASDAYEDKGKVDILAFGDKNEAVIRIEDQAGGMFQEVLRHIFEPFYSTKSSGSGLGLPISKQIIEKHGGWIEVESQPGKGAVFRFLKKGF